MNDCMYFPGTVEEFMEQYKVIDTDGIYMSKGCTLVPIFRMKQWFEHLQKSCDDTISRQVAIDALDEIRHALWEIDIPSPTVPEYVEHHEQVQSVWKLLDKKQKELYVLPSAQPDNSCDGCKYENADDGLLVPCGFCKRSHPDNYERKTDEADYRKE